MAEEKTTSLKRPEKVEETPVEMGKKRRISIGSQEKMNETFSGPGLMTNTIPEYTDPEKRAL